MAKNGKGVVIELPCFYDNINELTEFLKAENIAVEAKLVANFQNAFGDSFDASICQPTQIMQDGETEIAGMKFVITSNAEAFDVEIPEINCVYTHMMGHDCHSIVADCPHADGIISQLNYYIRKGFTLILTAHYTPEDLKDAETKIAYLKDLKEISFACENAEEMKKKVQKNMPVTAV